MRRLAGITLLLMQMAAVVHARLVPSRWLGAWAPNDYAVRYRLQVHVDSCLLSADETGERYGLRAEGVYENPVQNLMDIVRQREETYGREDHARVVLTYHRNRGRLEEWRWPEK